MGDVAFIPDGILEKRLIFILSPGRCGTAYLTTMASFIPDVAAFHEPSPDFAHALRSAMTEDDAARRYWLEKKLPHIATIPESIYFETSHLFKNFCMALLELGVTPDVVILSRPHREVALSYWQRGHLPGITQVGLRYFAKPDDLFTVLPMWGWQDLNGYQLCYWYCLETATRQKLYAPMLRERGARVYETTLAEITTEEGFAAMLSALNLPDPDWEQYRAMKNKRINALRKKLRRQLPSGEVLDEWEAEVRYRCGLA